MVQVWQEHACLLLAFHWLEFSHVAIPSCKGGWEMYSGHGPSTKGKWIRKQLAYLQQSYISNMHFFFRECPQIRDSPGFTPNSKLVWPIPHLGGRKLGLGFPVQYFCSQLAISPKVPFYPVMDIWAGSSLCLIRKKCSAESPGMYLFGCNFKYPYLVFILMQRDQLSTHSVVCSQRRVSKLPMTVEPAELCQTK